MTLKKAIEYKVPAFKFEGRQLSYNEECAKHGGRSYEQAKKPVPPAPEPK